MRVIKDEKIRETMVKSKGKVYLRREVDGLVSWKVSAGLDVTRQENFWVHMMGDEGIDLEAVFLVTN